MSRSFAGSSPFGVQLKPKKSNGARTGDTFGIELKRNVNNAAAQNISKGTTPKNLGHKSVTAAGTKNGSVDRLESSQVKGEGCD